MLLFFDIDGTIFDDDRRLPDSVLPAMEAAHRNGHQLIINTGRTLCNMDHRLDSFPLDGWILGCGTRILYHGEMLQSMEYDPEKSQRLRRVFWKWVFRWFMNVIQRCTLIRHAPPIRESSVSANGR